MRWTIIVINWNVKNLLRRCLQSIPPTYNSLIQNNPLSSPLYKGERGGYKKEETERGIEVFVIDNASEDGSAEMAQKEFPQARLLANKENIGFARAVNQGLQQAWGEYILLLNPDAALEPGALEEMEKIFIEHPQAGILGGKIFGPSGDIQPSVRGLPTLPVFVLTILKLHNFLAHRVKCLKKYFCWDFDYAAAQQADEVMGAFFAFPRAVWEKLNGFDENFFLWYEEVDFCKRVKEAGYEIWYLPSAVARHEKGESFKQVSAVRRQAVIQKSMRYYARKHFGFFAWLVVCILSPIGLLLAWIVQILKIKKSAKKQQTL